MHFFRLPTLRHSDPGIHRDRACAVIGLGLIGHDLHFHRFAHRRDRREGHALHVLARLDQTRLPQNMPLGVHDTELHPHVVRVSMLKVNDTLISLEKLMGREECKLVSFYLEKELGIYHALAHDINGGA